MKCNLGFWEDNPERLEIDIHKAEGSRKPEVVVASATTPAKETPTPAATPAKQADVPLVPRTKPEAKTLLVRGRKELEAGKLDDAARTAQRVKAFTAGSWGLFEDSPDRLQLDIDKARVKRDREEAARVLAEGRKLYEEGKYEEASRLAYKAQKLHGSYSIWELGDRPTRLLADIQDAQSRSRKKILPPAVVVKNEVTPLVLPETKPAPGNTMAKAGTSSSSLPAGITPTPAGPSTTVTASATIPAATVTASATTPAATVTASATTPAVPPPPATTTPTATTTASADLPPPLSSSVPPLGQASSGSGTSVPAYAPAPAAAVAAPNKLRAQQLVAEAQRLLREGKLIEARQKAIEAQGIAASFGPDEVGPEMIYQQIALQARHRTDSLLHQASEMASYGKGDPQTRLYRTAEEMLSQAKQLAVAFGQDTHAVDVKLADVRKWQAAPPQSSGGSALVADPKSMPQVDPGKPGAAVSIGQTLLEKARMELRRGETRAPLGG